METVTGIFASGAGAERAARRLEGIVRRDSITLLLPGETTGSLEISAGEQPGMGKAVGGFVGGAIGVAGGVEVAAAATALVPGVGPVIALGILGGALLGFLGAEAGQALERAAIDGLPEDESFVYQDALRRGHSLLIASAQDESAAAAVRERLEEEGAEAIDAAREKWWIGLRSAEQERYSQFRGSFDRDEQFYRLGFEAALHARNRNKQYDQILSEMQADIEELQRRYPGVNVEEPFRRGFERGRAYFQTLRNKGPR